jgi:hypothetical protein
MMSASWPRVIATFFIWFAYAASMIWGIKYNISEMNVVLMKSFPAAMAALATGIVWRGAFRSGDELPSVIARQIGEKIKHSDRSSITRLLDVLDEDETRALITELQERIAEQDGEPLSLEALLAEREARQRR